MEIPTKKTLFKNLYNEFEKFILRMEAGIGVIAIIGLAAFPEKLKMIIYVFLVLHIVIILSFITYFVYKIITFTPRPLINFSPYLKQLADLSHVDIYEYKKIHDNYIPLSGVDYSYDMNGKKIVTGKKVTRMGEIEEIHGMSWSSLSYFNQISNIQSYIGNYLALENPNPILISATAGTGKTTIVHRLAHKYAADWIADNNKPIPLLIRLRHWIPTEMAHLDKLLRAFINDYFREENGILDFSWSSFKKMVRDGKVILLLDGFDEVTRKAEEKVLKKYIEAIYTIVSDKSKIVLTTRPEVFKTLSILHEVVPLVTNPKDLTNEKPRFEALGINPLPPAMIKQFLINKNGMTIGVKIFNVLETSINLSNLAERPLLLQMISTAFTEIEESDLNEYSELQLYRDFTKNWFDRRNEAHHFQLETQEWQNLLATMSKHALKNSYQISQKVLETIIQDHNKSKTLEFRRTLENDLRVCTFLEHFNSLGVYRFNHRSFAEYFVAENYNRKNETNIEALFDFSETSISSIMSFADEEFQKMYLEYNPSGRSEIDVWLKFYINNFGSEVPIDVIENSKRFRIGENNKILRINLEGLYLKNFPIFVTKFKELERLVLRNNQISTLPDAIGNLNRIVILDLHNNKISNLTEEIGKLVNLKILLLDRNKISEIPNDVQYLENLHELKLQYNAIEKIPSGIGKLASLYYLNLKNNKIKEIPTSIGNLNNIKTLNLSDNDISELPTTFGDLVSMTSLDLSNNPLVSLPNSITNLQKLKNLNLPSNLEISNNDIKKWLNKLKSNRCKITHLNN